MEMISLGMRFAANATASEARSALPDAPVILDQETPRRRTRPIAVGPRVALAHLLERAAEAILPPPADCTPAH